MSSTVVSFIPTNSSRRVSDDVAVSAEQYLTAHYAGSTEIQINRSYIRPFFIDAGQNHEDIRCPDCGGSIPVSEWQDAMSECWVEADRGFDLTAAAVRCCNKDFYPDQLTYLPDQGFGMVSFEITEPSRTDHDAVAAHLSSVLGLPVRTIVARY